MISLFKYIEMSETVRTNLPLASKTFESRSGLVGVCAVSEQSQTAFEYFTSKNISAEGDYLLFLFISLILLVAFYKASRKLIVIFILGLILGYNFNASNAHHFVVSPNYLETDQVWLDGPFLTSKDYKRVQKIICAFSKITKSFEAQSDGWYPSDTDTWNFNYRHAAFAETIVLVMKIMNDIRHNRDRFVNAMLLTRLLTGKSASGFICATAFSAGQDLGSYFLRSFMTSLDDDIERESFEAQSFDFMDIVSDVNVKSKDYNRMLECDFGKKLVTLTSLLLAVPALNNLGIKPESFGLEDSFKHFWKRDMWNKSKIALPGLIAEHTSYIILKLAAIKRCGISALYVSCKDHEDFESLYIWLRKNSVNFARCTDTVDKFGNPEPFTLDGYLNKCSQALQLVDKISPSVRNDPYLRRLLNEQRMSVISYQNDCFAELKASERRPCPYAIMLCGPPGVGKTTIKDILLRQMHNIDNKSGRSEIPYSDNRVFTYNPNDEFYSQFHTDHTAIVIDDVAQLRPDIMKANNGGDLQDLIRIINSTPYSPNQAELHKKGRIPMRCRYFAGTTNTDDLNVQHIFNNKGAVYRRLVFIQCEVIDEYRNPGGIGLAGDPVDETNLNLWLFKVWKHTPTGGDRSEKKYLNFDASVTACKSIWGNAPDQGTISDLVHFMRYDMDQHWSSQEKSTAALDKLQDDPLCETCGISKSICGGNCWSSPWTGSTWPAQAVPWKRNPYITKEIGYNLLCTILMFLGWGANPMLGLMVSSGWLYQRGSKIFSLVALFAIYPTLVFYYISNYALRRYTMTERFWGFLIKTFISSIPDRSYLIYIEHWMSSNISPKVGRLFNFHYMNGKFEDIRFKSRIAYKRYMENIVQDYKFPIVVSILAILAAGLVFYKSKKSFEAEAVDTKMPEADEQEKLKKNYWIRENNIGVFPREGSTIDTYDINNQCMLNNVLLKISFVGGGGTTTNAFIVKSNLLVTVLHCLKDQEIDNIEITRLHKDGKYNKINIKVDDSCIYKDIKGDKLWLRHNKIESGRNLYKYLPSLKEPIKINCVGSMVFVNHNLSTHDYRNFKRIKKNEKECPNYALDGQYYSSDNMLIGFTTEPTSKGTCGAPIWVEQGKNKMIAGIHTAGQDLLTLINPISREEVDYVLSKFTFIEPLNDADNDVAWCAEAGANMITTVHQKCPTHNLNGEYHVIGGSALPRSRPRTHVAESPFVREVVKFYRKRGFDKVLHTSPIRCNPKQAIMHSMEKAVTNALFFPKEIAFAVAAMSQEFISKMDSTVLDRLHPYPMKVAINGVDNIPYIDRLNLLTSGGYGHPGPKRKLFQLVEGDEYHELQYDLTPELQLEIDYIENQYKCGDEANPVFKCCFKDEAITFEKAAINKVRIFSGSPTAFSLVVRKYLLCVIREFVSWKRLNFEMAIGANASGADWEEIYARVKRHGEDFCFAGDYKAFDKQMPPELILAAFEVITNILKAAGWDGDDLLPVRGIATDTAFPTTDLFGTLIQLYGSNPSGHVLTTPINSLVNSLYMRIASKRILERNNIVVDLQGPNTLTHVNMSNFSDVMSLVTYGDDNCGSINKNYHCINHTTLQEALAEVGIIYTMDIKNAESVGFVNVRDISFLKRKFHYDTETNRILAPLLEESIFKSLTVWTYSNTIDKHEQMAEVLCSASREYFMYGRDTFNLMRCFFLTLVEIYDLYVWLPQRSLLTYDEIKIQLGFKDGP